MIFWVVKLCGGIGGYQHFEGNFVPWRSRQYFYRNDGWPHRVTTHKTTINIPYSSPWDPLHLYFLGNVNWETSPSMWLISCEDVIEFSRRESKMSCIDSKFYFILYSNDLHYITYRVYPNIAHRNCISLSEMYYFGRMFTVQLHSSDWPRYSGLKYPC